MDLCVHMKTVEGGGDLQVARDTTCSSPFTEAVPPRRDRSIRGVPPSVNGLVHSLSVPHLREWTSSFAECTHFVIALHAYMRTHVCTLGWPYPVEFN